MYKKVFGEALGLDVGWNCHISLSDGKIKAHPDSDLNEENENQLQPKLTANKKSFNTSLPNLVKTKFNKTQMSSLVKFDLSNLKSDRHRRRESSLKDSSTDDDEETLKTDYMIRRKSAEEKKKFLNRHRSEDEENSSHRTLHSERTLSDTEIVGNAV
jgi:hypothetical protein